MTMIQYTAEVRAGLLLALPTEAEELHLQAGDKVLIQLAREGENVQQVTLNDGMLAALHKIAERQTGRRYTDASDTDLMLREARAGAMWEQESIAE